VSKKDGEIEGTVKAQLSTMCPRRRPSLAAGAINHGTKLSAGCCWAALPRRSSLPLDIHSVKPMYFKEHLKKQMHSDWRGEKPKTTPTNRPKPLGSRACLPAFALAGW